MVAMELKEEGQDIVKKCLEEGALINCAAKKVLRFTALNCGRKRDRLFSRYFR